MSHFPSSENIPIRQYTCYQRARFRILLANVKSEMVFSQTSCGSYHAIKTNYNLLFHLRYWHKYDEGIKHTHDSAVM